MRKRTVLIISIYLLLFSSVPAFATESSVQICRTNEPTFYMDYIANASGTLYINSAGTATVESWVNGYQGITTQVQISANLQQYQNGYWVTLKTFKVSDISHRTSLNETYNVTKGYIYRVQATIKAYSGSASETRTVTSGEVSY